MIKLSEQLIVTLAWRNLWRNHRRTTIMLLAIGLGVWAMIVLTALLRGMVDDMVNRSINSLPGHLQIHRDEYLIDPNIAYAFDASPTRLLDFIHSRTDLEWVERLSVASIITSERDFRGVELIGLNPDRESLNRLDLKLLAGEELTPSSDGVMIGSRLAEKLETKVGRRIVLTTQGREDATRERGVRIVGIYSADLASVEERVIYSSLELVQELTQASGLVTEIAVFVGDITSLELVQMELQDRVDDGLVVRNHRQIDSVASPMQG